MRCSIILTNVELLERNLKRQEVWYEKRLIDLISILLCIEAELITGTL